MESATTRRAMRLGGLFQFPMMALFIATLELYDIPKALLSPWYIPSHLGALLFLYCLVRIYVAPLLDRLQKRKRARILFTTGPFKYTRHPMYTGLMLMDLILWVPQPTSNKPLFFVLQAAFVGCLVMAAYFQEKETLARFGDEARAYYAKTPRLFFMYPFTNKRE